MVVRVDTTVIVRQPCFGFQVGKGKKNGQESPSPQGRSLAGVWAAAVGQVEVAQRGSESFSADITGNLKCFFSLCYS